MGLENLWRMRDAHKRAEEKENLVHPVTEEEIELGEHDRTLAEIFQDKKEQDKFLNRFCYDKNPDQSRKIVDSLASGTELSAKQNAFLEKMREAYNVRSTEVEQVREMLTEENKEYIKRIGENDPRIKQIIGQIGPDKTAELLGKEFEDLALSDERKFKKTVDALKHLHDLDTKDITENLNRKVQETLQRFGINEEQYWEATRGGRTYDTKEKLDKLAAEQFGLFRKAVDFATGGGLSHRRGRELYKNFGEQSAILEEADKHLKVVGKVLQGTLTSDVNLAIQKAMLEGGEVKEKKVENNVTTIQDYRRVKEEIAADMTSVDSRWEQFKTAETTRLNIRDISKQPDALEGMKSRFAEKEYQKQKSYRGIGAIGILLAILFGTRTQDDIKNSLK